MTEPLAHTLHGLRIGLSGAIPEQTEWAGRALDWEILNAVSTLADTVFDEGGHLVHGAHPSFTPRILAQAEPYAEERGKPVVTFVLSGLFAQEHLAKQLGQECYRKVLELIVVDPVVPPGAEGHGAEDPRVRNESLTAMRQRLIGEIDALVVIGGKHWRGSPNTPEAVKPGTAQELEMAIDRAIPCFLLGGFGGMAAELAKLPDYPARLANGLTEEDNQYLLTTDNYGRAVAIIAERLGASVAVGNLPAAR